ncbi:GntR family transcriptional regulator [Frigidibacter sp. MR17.24]|uniref:GntR family transcriptional regulator n=1 Tax=Frigidibacter sp. MR17.24 TaxID=3127345 RepID=UPI00301305FA
MALQTETRIVRHVLDAIADQKLHAGTKLGELELAAIFACSRAQIRRALAMLAQYGVIELRRNRGAFVIVPGPDEARQVFEARRAIEAVICRNVVANADEVDFARLRAHLADEARAGTAMSRSQVLRLSRRFHLILAEIGRNAVLEKYLAELTLRSALILGCWGTSRDRLCASGEHDEILAAIEARDTALAVALLDHHLMHLQDEIDFSAPPPARSPLAQVLAAD